MTPAPLSDATLPAWCAPADWCRRRHDFDEAGRVLVLEDLGAAE